MDPDFSGRGFRVQVQLLEVDSFRIHYRNLQKLAAKIFEVKTNIAPEVIKDIFRIVEFGIHSEMRLNSGP